MSYFSGLSFFVVLFIALIPAVILGLTQKSRKIYCSFVSSVFILFIVGQDKKQILYLSIFIFCIIHLIMIYLRLRRKYGRNKVIYYHALIIGLLPLILCKVSEIFDKNIFAFIGISYITFKVLQLIIDIYDGIITELKFLDVINFIIFFPTFSSGPIDRSKRFTEDFNVIYNRKEYLQLLSKGLEKILLGMVYKIVFSAICYMELQKVTAAAGFNVIYPIKYAYLYGFYMFFDFAGYSLMAIGVSYIMGIRTPDNFNKPFISCDMIDFWNRWHISLSHWFRDFIFSRFMINSLRNKWFKNRLDRASWGFIVNMLIMGFWHGLTSYYVLYGLYHGVILALTERFQKKSSIYKKYKNKNWFRFCSWAITINLVMFGFLIFSEQFNIAIKALVTRIL